MIINKIRMLYDDKTVSYPKNGNFSKGVNLLYSKANNFGKTTLMRSIIGAFFSSSIEMPKFGNEFKNLKNIIVEFKILNNIFELNYILSTRENIITNIKDNSVNIFNNKNDLIKFIFKLNNNKTFNSLARNDSFKVSWIGDRFLMDQDFPCRSTKLFRSYYNKGDNGSLIFDFIDLWLIEFTAFNAYCGDDNKGEISLLNRNIKELDKVIKNFLLLSKSNATGNTKYDYDEIKSKKEEYFNIMKKMSKCIDKIKELEAENNQFKKLSPDYTKGFNDYKSMYIVAFDYNKQQHISVKANLNSFLNWTEKPLKTIRVNAKKTMDENNERIIKLKNENEHNRNKLNKLKKYLYDTNTKITNLNLEELLTEKNNLEAKIIEIKKSKNSDVILKSEVKKNKKMLDIKSEEIFNSFSSMDSKSGSDLFIRKFSEYFAFALNKSKNSMNFPLIIDSINEKDVSNINKLKIFKMLYGYARANNAQVFVTQTCSEYELRDFNLYINKKYELK